jgi:pyrroloquinoline quinone (PQQ) biosynthesis protein C
MIKVTPHPTWIQDFLKFIKPFQDGVVNNRLFVNFINGKLTKKQCQGAIINFYPLIESFPQYMALNLAKVPAGYSNLNKKTRYWLITNINQERLHAGWWRQFASGFGVPRDALDREFYPPPAMDAINNYLWRVSTHGSLAEGMSAVNFAVEGPTGEWTKNIKSAFNKYRKVQGVDINENTLEWVTAHAGYDDKHPVEALEIIKAFATTKEEQEKVRQAAKRALEYYALALDTCYDLFK